MGYRVGVDIGGSFTDLALLDDRTGEVRSLKVFSRPDRPGEEVLAGLAGLRDRHGIAPAEIGYFTHGTTVGVNTVIQRKGPRLALLVTQGFRDVLELGRLRAPDMYDLLSKRPAPLVTRDRVFELPERLAADGSVLQALSDAHVLAAAQAALAAGAEGIVVALLHAWRNPAHERQAREALARAHPGLPVLCSAEVWPVLREYERTVTATIAGYVQPRVTAYLDGLQAALREIGVPCEARVTRSNGGVMTAERGRREGLQMVLSGTAAGVIGAGFVARIAGLRECLSLDIGGTSADVALIRDGQPRYGSGEEVGEFRIHIPSVAVSSIGEGGGSIAWVDGFGVLQVGPESAGSTPGPACFGRGGTRPTVTDAFAACGLLGRADLGHGAARVDADRARAAIGTVAQPLGRGVEETAQAMIEVAVSGMYARIGAATARFGVDPRETALLAFGGAGPMLGCFLARELGVAEVLVPPTPGVLSALGGLIADLRSDFLRTLYLPLDEAATDAVRAGFADLRRDALDWLRGEQGHDGEAQLGYSADCRYRGQSYEIEAPLDDAAALQGDTAVIAAAFHAAHAALYGHADPEAPVQVIALRVTATGPTPKPVLSDLPAATASPMPFATDRAWLDGAWREVAFHDRAALRAGHRLHGPVVVTQEDCTTVVPPGQAVLVDRHGCLRIRAEEAAP
ncbi:hydantoinase/oxoprolinase family protein [Paracraurococcus ruber]|uniref:Hydantoinase n=1 Tax=Paracraurococcus ruber TaxID=77675 RepID=A0ABS1CVH5_9PROT|nr:hydantoinase/oxoprolinase family protein [Paracraurococcus ruber]MBK1658404.1 hydantoinase [Paracraurococcus ruber]TDG30753.1 hydantoinase/oxoprolinase family protein [Paracraurococcus ruber]